MIPRELEKLTGKRCNLCASTQHKVENCPTLKRTDEKPPSLIDIPKRVLYCTICNEEGHVRKDCPTWWKTPSFSGVCKTCYEAGHETEDCPKAPKKPPPPESCIGVCHVQPKVVAKPPKKCEPESLDIPRSDDRIRPDANFYRLKPGRKIVKKRPNDDCSVQEPRPTYKIWTRPVCKARLKPEQEKTLFPRPFPKDIPKPTMHSPPVRKRPVSPSKLKKEGKGKGSPTTTQEGLTERVCPHRPGKKECDCEQCKTQVWKRMVLHNYPEMPDDTDEENSLRMKDQPGQAGRLCACLPDSKQCDKCNTKKPEPKIGVVKKPKLQMSPVVYHKYFKKIGPEPCTICNKKGHTAYSCPEFHRYRSEGALIKAHICELCDRRGHLEESCPTREIEVCMKCLAEGHNELNCIRREDSIEAEMPAVVCKLCFEVGHNEQNCNKRKSGTVGSEEKKPQIIEISRRNQLPPSNATFYPDYSKKHEPECECGKSPVSEKRRSRLSSKISECKDEICLAKKMQELSTKQPEGGTAVEEESNTPMQPHKEEPKFVKRPKIYPKLDRGPQKTTSTETLCTAKGLDTISAYLQIKKPEDVSTSKLPRKTLAEKIRKTLAEWNDDDKELLPGINESQNSNKSIDEGKSRMESVETKLSYDGRYADSFSLTTQKPKGRGSKSLERDAASKDESIKLSPQKKDSKSPSGNKPFEKAVAAKENTMTYPQKGTTPKYVQSALCLKDRVVSNFTDVLFTKRNLVDDRLTRSAVCVGKSDDRVFLGKEPKLWNNDVKSYSGGINAFDKKKVSSSSSLMLASMQNVSFCYHCGKKGHKADDCSVSKNSSFTGKSINEIPSVPNAGEYCMRCGDKSHRTMDCTSELKRPTLESAFDDEGNNMDEVRCTTCGRKGHYAHSCPDSEVYKRPGTSSVGLDDDDLAAVLRDTRCFTSLVSIVDPQDANSKANEEQC